MRCIRSKNQVHNAAQANIKMWRKKYSVRTDLNLCNTRSFKHFFIIFVHQMFKDLKLSAIKYNVEKATKQSSSGEEKNVS